ncbi:MAG: UDP-N-acetylglucosamine diphosphorylase/glucosamine-1-phosphate N-acetyltransferase, partial [Deltaproteobacteria bacterium]|nr:UDP-N-acetylglucosamine diphosphorylase/glucosamine-1-phosphate N-acetyltransferase [Deltaproteobacteria bacterium]
MSLLTAYVDRPTGYGRVLRDAEGKITRIVEEKDASGAEKKIKEVNAGIYAVSAKFLFSALDDLNNQNRQGEYYLPDIVRIAHRDGKTVGDLRVDDPREMLGVNTREELA